MIMVNSLGFDTWGFSSIWRGGRVGLSHAPVRKITTEMPVSNNCSNLVIGSEDHYKFLEKYQNTQHLEDRVIEEASKEYEDRL